MTTEFQQRLDSIFGEAVSDQELAAADLAWDIAVQFAALRHRRGLTQKDVAARLGRTQQAVSRIENPDHNGHDLTSLKRAVEALDAILDVTIVPLEDTGLYGSLLPPKPVLEELTARRPDQAVSISASPILSFRPAERRPDWPTYRRPAGSLTPPDGGGEHLPKIKSIADFLPASRLTLTAAR